MDSVPIDKRGRFYKPRKGVPVRPEVAARLRTQNFKHGKNAEKVTMEEALTRNLRRGHKNLPELIEAYAKAVAQSSPLEVDPVVVAGLATKAVMRMQIMEAIQEKGLLLDDQFFDKDGNQIGARTKANPLLEQLRWVDEQLGLTANDQQITRKSSREGAKDAALTRELERRARLQNFTRENPKRLPPAPIQDAEVLPD